MNRRECMAALAAVMVPVVKGESAGRTSNLLVFVHASNPVENIPSGQLRQMLTGDISRWKQNGWISIVLVGSGDEVLSRIFRTVLKMTLEEYKRLLALNHDRRWASEPQIVETPEAASNLVATKRGVLTIMEGDPETVIAGAKLVKIDGKLPTDEGYRYAMK